MMRYLTLPLALTLAGCTTTGALQVGASAVDAAGVHSPAPAQLTVIDEKAITLAARSVDAVALSASALVRAGVIRPGTPTALALATALDDARKAVNAAELARQAGSTTSYRQALDRALAAVDQVKSLIGG